jgi:teichuronic acid biosynthesis glycosyltransferase TuaC
LKASSFLNICLFTPSFLPDVGGMEVVLDKLARQFMDRGHKVAVIAQRSRRSSEIPQLPYEIIYYRRPRSAVWLLQNVKHVLLREYRKHRFDIVHAHLTYPNGYVACKLKEKLGVPIVITSHKGDIIPDSRYRQRYITRKRMCWALRKAEAATGVSTELKEIIDELSCGKAYSLVIPNGVDIPGNTPGEMPESCAAIDGREFMLTLGRLHHYKGLDILLEALKLLGEQGAEIPYLVIAGDGKEMQSLQQQAKKLLIEDKVLFAGSVFGPQKHWLLRNCKFFVQPSRAEGMPLTVLEAMAYGKAVIGTNIKGIAQLITNSESGFLVEPANSEPLAQAIAALCKNKDIGRIEAGAKAVASQMTWPIIADRYLDLYRQLLK